MASVPAAYNLDMVNEIIIKAIESRPRGTKSALAKALDVAPSTITKWVSFHTNPEVDRWPDIEAFFDMEPGTLAEAAGFTRVPVSQTQEDDFDFPLLVQLSNDGQVVEVRDAVELVEAIVKNMRTADKPEGENEARIRAFLEALVRLVDPGDDDSTKSATEADYKRLHDVLSGPLSLAASSDTSTVDDAVRAAQGKRVNRPSGVEEDQDS